MSLIDRLVKVAHQLPPSHVVGQYNVASVLSALLLLEEHGEAILDAAEDAEHGVMDFLTEHAERAAAEQGDQPAEGPAPAQSAPTAPGVVGAVPNTAAPQTVPVPSDQKDPSRDDLIGEVQRLRAQLADRDRATVTSEPAPEEAPVDPGHPPDEQGSFPSGAE